MNVKCMFKHDWHHFSETHRYCNRCNVTQVQRDNGIWDVVSNQPINLVEHRNNCQKVHSDLINIHVSKDVKHIERYLKRHSSVSIQSNEITNYGYKQLVKRLIDLGFTVEETVLNNGVIQDFSVSMLTISIAEADWRLLDT